MTGAGALSEIVTWARPSAGTSTFAAAPGLSVACSVFVLSAPVAWKSERS